jgi:hypothetical protein
MVYGISLKLFIQLTVLYILHEEVKRSVGKKYFYPIARKYNLSHCISWIARELETVCILGH